jgi:hypothetical protein
MVKMNRISVLMVTISLLVVLSACSNDSEEQAESTENIESGEEVADIPAPPEEHIPVEGAEQPPQQVNDQASENLLTLNTKNITRLNSDDPIELSILTSQTIWPATHPENQPGALILAPVDEWQLALASLNLVHHPNDGPLLFTEAGVIPERVLTEIERLQPKGNDEGTQVIVMGELKGEELAKLGSYETVQVSTTDPAEFAYEIDQMFSDLAADVPNEVIIGSLEDEAMLYSLVAGGWISHMNEPILFMENDSIPQATKDALEKRNGYAHMYVVAPESIIGEEMIEQLREYGDVTRIAGETPTEMSIEFAKFKDVTTDFGWGVNKPGHGIVIASTKMPMLAVTAAPFAHLGKHAPTVWLAEGELNTPMYEFLARLKPSFEIEPQEGPYNHGYLLGSTDSISFITQGIIDEKLEIVPASGAGHHH